MRGRPLLRRWRRTHGEIASSALVVATCPALRPLVVDDREGTATSGGDWVASAPAPIRVSLRVDMLFFLRCLLLESLSQASSDSLLILLLEIGSVFSWAGSVENSSSGLSRCRIAWLALASLAGSVGAPLVTTFACRGTWASDFFLRGTLPESHGLSLLGILYMTLSPMLVALHLEIVPVVGDFSRRACPWLLTLVEGRCHFEAGRRVRVLALAQV